MRSLYETSNQQKVEITANEEINSKTNIDYNQQRS